VYTYVSYHKIKLEMWGKAQRKSARRRRLSPIAGKFKGAKIPPVAKSHDPYALAYAERALST